MLEFNNNHIITGQIKEILSSFNLPKYRIYTKENQDYFNTYHAEKNIIPTVKRNIPNATFPAAMLYNPYIKDGFIQYYIHDTATNTYYWENTNQAYAAGEYVVNWTKNLKITNNIYDSYTHEYLGEYLRFKRDYENIDLMPLYNCFSNRICTALDIKFKLSTETISFETINPDYKIYMLPVKLFKKYTIAIDCATSVEVCCGIYGKYQNTDTKYNILSSATYKKFNKLIFNQPVIYDVLDSISNNITAGQLADLAQIENDLKLFIKLPVNNTSSIVILEGDYRSYNDSILKYAATRWTTKDLWKTTGNFYINDTASFSAADKNNGDLYYKTDSKALSVCDTNPATQVKQWRLIKTFSQSKSYNYGAALPALYSTTVSGYEVFIVTEGNGTTNPKPGTLYFANNILKRIQNRTIINFNTKDIIIENNIKKEQDFSTFKPITALQLLRANTKKHYPFADRLIEYLCGNVIDSNEDLLDNIKRVQAVIKLNRQNPDPETIIYDAAVGGFKKQGPDGKAVLNKDLLPKNNGAWDNSIRAIVYEKFNDTVKANNNDTNHDILGYIDKDIEKYYGASTGKKENNNVVYTSILGMDLYTTKDGLYSDDPEENE